MRIQDQGGGDAGASRRSRGVWGGPGILRGVQTFWAEKRKNTKNQPNGSGYPLSVPAVAHPPPIQGVKRGKGGG